MTDKHVVSLEIAKQLKDAGWQKETEFWWDLFTPPELTQSKSSNKEYQISAPLATEILEELPREVSIKQYPENDSVRYQVGHNADKMTLQTYRYNNNLCDALAEMWLYLRKEKLGDKSRGDFRGN